jgi:hypothetical protein
MWLVRQTTPVLNELLIVHEQRMFAEEYEVKSGRVGGRQVQTRTQQVSVLEGCTHWRVVNMTSAGSLRSANWEPGTLRRDADRRATT